MSYETGRFKFLDQMFWSSPGYGGVRFHSTTYATAQRDLLHLERCVPGTRFDRQGDLADSYRRSRRRTVQSPVSANHRQRHCGNAIHPTLEFRCATRGWKATVASVGYVGSKGTSRRSRPSELPRQGVYLNSDEFYYARPLTPIAPDRWDSILAVHHNRSNNYNALTTQLKTQSGTA